MKSRPRASNTAAAAPQATLWFRLAPLVVLVAGLAAYANSFDGVFVFDDEPALEHSSYVRTLWPLAVSMSAPEGSTLSGRPVASLSFAIDYARSSGVIRAYHETNLLIHLLSALLLFGVVRRTLASSRLAAAFSNTATPLAFIIAVIFVVHPLQTGSVTYIVQRVESLMGLFYLATLYAAIRSADAAGARVRALWAAGAVSFCALGMATKEVMVSAPLVVILWDWIFVPDRPPRKGFYFSLAATWFILAALVATGPRTASVGFGFAEWPWWRYLLTQTEVVSHYLRLSLLPSPLVLDYEWPAVSSWQEVLGPIVLLGAMGVATLSGLLKRHPAAFPLVWVFLILAPSSSVLPIVTEVAAEHRMYLPLAGIVTLVVVGVFALGRRLATRSPRLATPLSGLGMILALAVVALLGLATRARNEDYQSYDRIWSDTVNARPLNSRARNNLASSLLLQARYSEAETHLRVAVKQRPGFGEAQANLGVALAAQGDLDQGIAHLLEAVKLSPDYADARRNLAEALAMEGRLAEAAFHYGVALESNPQDVHLLNRVAWILATAPDATVRNGARARELASRAVRLTGRRDAESLDTLAAASAETGDFAAAAESASEALALATQRGPADLVAEISSRAALYARGRPFRTTGGPP